MQKGFAGIYILIILLIVGGLGGTYFLGKLPIKSLITQTETSISPSPQAQKVGETKNVGDNITNIQCDAKKRCPENLECWVFEKYDKPGAWCVTPNPMEWYCQGKVGAVLESYPPILKCGSVKSLEVDETANWKKYTSRYDYSIKYPSNWQLKTSDWKEGPWSYSLQSDDEVVIRFLEPDQTPHGGFPSGTTLSLKKPQDNPENLSARRWAEKVYSPDEYTKNYR